MAAARWPAAELAAWRKHGQAAAALSRGCGGEARVWISRQRDATVRPVTHGGKRGLVGGPARPATPSLANDGGNKDGLAHL